MPNWIAVASAEHVQKGRFSGFMQVCHGKGAPLRRMKPNDWVVYYSPNVTFGGKDKLQSFTAIGQIKEKATPPVPTVLGISYKVFNEKNHLYSILDGLTIHIGRM